MKKFMNSIVFMGLLLIGNNLFCAAGPATRMSDTTFKDNLDKARTAPEFIALANANPGETARLDQITKKAIATIGGSVYNKAGVRQTVDTNKTRNPLPATGPGPQPQPGPGPQPQPQPQPQPGADAQQAIQDAANAVNKTFQEVKKTYQQVQGQLNNATRNSIEAIPGMR